MHSIDGGNTAKASPLSTVPGLLLACTASCLLWGSAFPCTKIAYRMFGIGGQDTGSIMAFAGSRFALAGVLVIVGVSVARRRPLVPGHGDWGAVLELSLFQTVLQYALFCVGLGHASGVTSSIIEGSNAFVTVILSCLVFRSERISAQKVLGCVVGFAGVALVTLDGAGTGQATFTFMGEGMVLLSTVAAAMSSNIINRLSQAHDAVMLSGWQFLVGGLELLAAGLLLGGRVEPAPGTSPAACAALLVYMALISAVAYTLWSLALKANPVSRVAVFGFMNPVFGVILSAALLDETSVLRPSTAIAALALVSAGIVIVNRVAPAKSGAQGTADPTA